METLVISKIDGKEYRYELEDISTITNGKAKYFASKDVMKNTGFKSNDSCVVINFKDGSILRFGKSYSMSFE